MALKREFDGVQLTAFEHKPAFVQQGRKIESPTVWYGGELTAEVRPNYATNMLGC